MGKVLKVVTLVAAVALAIPTGGTSLLAVTLGVSAFAAASIVGGLTLASAILNKPKSPRIPLSLLDRLNASLVPSAPRKIVFGETAMSNDIRYVEPSGTNQEFVDYIFHLASHKCQSVDALYIEDKIAWTPGGGAAGIYAGFLTVEVITEAGAAAFHTVNSGSKWGSAQRLTGCCTAKVRIKRTGNSNKSESPFASGLPSKIVWVGKGLPLYDPRRDSTVPGGSGTHRADDQTTWQYTDGAVGLGQNTALQSLAWHIGWRIGGVVSVGLGMSPARLDMAAFAVAANICDEAVSLAAGGTQRRYETAGVVSDFDDSGTILGQFSASVNGWFDDSSGKLGLYIAVNDLAGALPVFDDNDILAAYDVNWNPFPATPINVVRGTNTDPSPATLYQLTDYPERSIASVDGIDRAAVLDLPFVQEKRRAQRIAAQVLQRLQHQGEFTCTLGIRGWLLKRGDPIKLTYALLGWAEKLFRVADVTFNGDATVNVGLREENASIYSWAASETAVVTPASAVVYDPLNAPFILAAGEAGDAAAAAQSTASINLYRAETSNVVSARAFVAAGISEVTFGTPGGLDKTPATSTIVNIILADVGLAAGDIISVRGLIEYNASAGQDARVRLRYKNALGADAGSLVDGAAIPTPTGPVVVVLENKTIPAGAYAMTVGIRISGGTGTATIRAVQVNRGPVAAPYSVPTRGVATAPRNLLLAANVGSVVRSGSPSQATADSTWPLLSVLGVSAGDVISVSADLTALSDPWLIEVRARDAADVIIAGTVSGIYSNVAGRRKIEGYVVPVTATKIELQVRRESGTGSVTVSRQMVNAGPYAAAFAGTYEDGATQGAVAGVNLRAADGVTIFADSDIKTSLGTALNTTNVGSSTATQVALARVNFDARNDRNAAAVIVPTILTDATAVDHVTNTDGSADISFEWAWAGSEVDIDGFVVLIYSSTSASAYTFGTTPAAETVIVTDASKRAFTVAGVPANRYYTFGVRAFRVVDPDINAAGRLQSSIVKPSLAAENPYRPSSTVAFAGDLSGTISGVSASSQVAKLATIADNATATVPTNLLSRPASRNEAAAWALSGEFSSGANGTAGGWGAHRNVLMLSVNLALPAGSARPVEKTPLGGATRSYMTVRWAWGISADANVDVYIAFYDVADAQTLVLAGSLDRTAAAGVYQEKVFSAAAPVGSVSFRPYFTVGGTTGVFRIDEVFALTSEPGADITATSVPRHEPSSASLSFSADFQGAVSPGDQLPETVQIKRYLGSTDVSSDAGTTWVVVNQGSITGGTVTVSDGVVVFPAGLNIPPSTTVEVKSSRGGFDIRSIIAVVRIDTPPPNTGTSTGGTTVNDASLDSVSSTTSVKVSDTMVVHTGSAGQIDFAGNLSITGEKALELGSFGAVAQWKYKLTSGGTLANAGAAINDLSPLVIDENFDPPSYTRTIGSINVARVLTGLTAGTDYNVELWMARDSSTPAKTISFGGSVSASGT